MGGPVTELKGPIAYLTGGRTALFKALLIFLYEGDYISRLIDVPNLSII